MKYQGSDLAKFSSRLCEAVSITRMLAGEWGSRNLRISVPLVWKRFASEMPPIPVFEFSTESTIVVSAGYNGISQISYEIGLGDCTPSV